MRREQLSSDGPIAWVLETPEEVENLARSLEEAAARVRTWPPRILQYKAEDENDVDEGTGMISRRRPLCRIFDLEWPA